MSGQLGGGVKAAGKLDNFPGSILLTEANKTTLVGWHGNPSKIWTLCFRATTDGFSPSVFHSKCDNR